jgi:hypothetical protein
MLIRYWPVMNSIVVAIALLRGVSGSAHALHELAGALLPCRRHDIKVLSMGPVVRLLSLRGKHALMRRAYAAMA